MFKCNRRSVVLSAAGLAVCLVHTFSGVRAQRSGATRQSEGLQAQTCRAGEPIPDEVLVRFVDGATRSDVRSIVDKIAESNRPIAIRQISSILNLYLIRSRGLTADLFVGRLTAKGLAEKVQKAENNSVLCLEGSNYDQWALKDYQADTPGISAISAWGLTTGTKDIVVGVIDSGIDMSHPDLRPNLWKAPVGFRFKYEGRSFRCPTGWNSINHNCDPDDSGWHGTHVSGIIGAKGNNRIGIDGVNWTVSLMPLKAFGPDGTGPVDAVIEAIDFAVQAKRFGVNMKVLNNSYGQRCTSNKPCPSPNLEEAIKLANKEGILFVASAGENASQHNNDDAPHYPSSFDVDNVIAVAWTNKRDELSKDSNYGPRSVDLGAPGSAIWSTFPLKYGDKGGYHVRDGTSMSTPFVSGAAALVLSRCPDLRVGDLKKVLLSTVDPIASLKGKTVTGGRLNVFEAVKRCR